MFDVAKYLGILELVKDSRIRDVQGLVKLLNEIRVILQNLKLKRRKECQ